jgi:hypothetical protein
MSYTELKNRISLIDNSILDYNEDTELGGKSIRMRIMLYDVVDKILFNDNNIRSIDIEVKLKSGHLSINDLIDEVNKIKSKYQIFRDDLEGFDVNAEDFYDKKYIFIEPLFGM